MINRYTCQLIALSILITVDTFSCYPLDNNLFSSDRRDSSLQSQEAVGSENTRNTDLQQSRIKDGSENVKYLESGGKNEGLDDIAEFYNELVESNDKLESEDEGYDLDDIRDRLDALEDSRYKRESFDENGNNYLTDASDAFAGRDDKQYRFNEADDRKENVDSSDKREESGYNVESKVNNDELETVKEGNNHVADSSDRFATSDVKQEGFNKAEDISENVGSSLDKHEESGYDLEPEANNDEPETVGESSDHLDELEENLQNLDETIEKLQGGEISDEQLVAFHDIAAKIQDLAALDDQALADSETQDKVDSESVPDEIENVLDDQAEDGSKKQDELDSSEKSSQYVADEIEDVDDTVNNEGSFNENTGQIDNLDENGELLEGSVEYNANEEGGTNPISGLQTNQGEVGDESQLVEEVNPRLISKREINDFSSGKTKSAGKKFNNDVLNEDSTFIDNSQDVNEFDNDRPIEDSEEDDNVEMAENDSNYFENTDQFLEGKGKLNEEGPKHINPERMEHQGMSNVGAEYEDNDQGENNIDSEDGVESAVDSVDSELNSDDEHSYIDDEKYVQRLNKETFEKRETCGGKNKTCGSVEHVISTGRRETCGGKNKTCGSLLVDTGKAHTKISAGKTKVDSANKKSAISEEDNEYRYEENEIVDETDNLVESDGNSDNGITNDSEEDSLNLTSNEDEDKSTNSDKMSEEIDKIKDESEKTKENLAEKEKGDGKSSVDEVSSKSLETKVKSDEKKPSNEEAIQESSVASDNNHDKLKTDESYESKLADLLKGVASEAGKDDVTNQSGSQKGENVAETKSILNSSPSANSFDEKKTEFSRQALSNSRPETSEGIFKNLYIQQLCDEIKHEMELSYMANIPAERITDIVKRELEHDLRNLNSHNSLIRKRAIIHRDVDPSQSIGEFLKSEVTHELPGNVQQVTRDMIGEYIEKVFNDYFKNQASEENSLHDAVEKDAGSRGVKVSPARVIINGVPESEYFQLYPTKKESLEHSKNKKNYVKKDSSANNPYLDNPLDKLLHNIKDAHQSNSRGESKPVTRLSNQPAKKNNDKEGFNGEYIKIEVFNIDDGKTHNSKHEFGRDKKHDSTDSDSKKRDKKPETEESYGSDNRKRLCKDRNPGSMMNSLEKEGRKKLKPMYVDPEVFDSVGQLHERQKRHLLSFDEGNVETDGEAPRHNRRVKRNPRKDTFWAKAKREVEILSRIKDPAEGDTPYHQNIVKRRLNKELGHILNGDTKLNNRNERASHSVKSNEMNNELNSVLIGFAEKYLSNDKNEFNSNDHNNAFRDGSQSLYENESPRDGENNEYDYNNPKRRRLLGLSYNPDEMSHNAGYRASKRADNLIDWVQALKPHASIRKRDLSTDPLNGYDAHAEQGNVQKAATGLNQLLEGERTIQKGDSTQESPAFEGVKVESDENVEKNVEKRDLSGDPAKITDVRLEEKKAVSSDDGKSSVESNGAALSNGFEAAAEIKTPSDQPVPVSLNTNSQLANDVDSNQDKVTVKRRSHLERPNGALDNEPLMNRLGRMDLSQDSLDLFDDIKERTGRTDLSGIAMNGNNVDTSNVPEERRVRSAAELLMYSDLADEEPLSDLELGLLKVLEKINLDKVNKNQDLLVRSENNDGETELVENVLEPKQVSADKENEINAGERRPEMEESDEPQKNHIKKRDLAEDLLYSFGGPSEDSDRRGSNVKKALNADYMDYLDDKEVNPGEHVEKRSLNHDSDSVDSLDYVPTNQLSEVDMLLSNGENSWSDVSMDYNGNVQQKRDAFYPLDETENFQDKLEDIVEKHSQGMKAGYDEVGNYVSPEIVEKISRMRRKRGNSDEDRKRVRRHKIQRPAYLFPESNEYEHDEYDRDEEDYDDDDDDEEEEDEDYGDKSSRKGKVERCLNNGDIEDETINKEETPGGCSTIDASWKVRLVIGLLVCLRYYAY